MFWGITGGVISILCALIPYILSQREKTLRYWQIEAESIFSNKIKEIKNLNISYKGNELSDNVIILKTVIENNGKKDIDSTIVYEPLQILFQEGIELLDYELIESPAGVTLKSIDNGIECKWDLFKKKEFIVLKIMLKKNVDNIQNKEILQKYTKISYRITNVNDIKKRLYTKSLEEKPSKIFIGYFILALFCAGLIIIPLSLDFYQIRYKSSLLPEQTFTVKVKGGNSIILQGTKQKKIVSIEEYNKAKAETEIVLIKETVNIGLMIFFVSAIILFFVPTFLFLFEYLTDKKVHSFFYHREE